MTDLLILGAAILLVGPLTETDDAISNADLVYPKGTIPGYQIVSTALPEGFSPAAHQWIGGTLVHVGDTPPPAPVPDAVPMRSARLALYAAGLLPQVQALIDGMTGEQGDLARIDWNTAPMVRRDNPLVLYMVATLPLTDEACDDLFRAAGQIT